MTTRTLTNDVGRQRAVELPRLLVEGFWAVSTVPSPIPGLDNAFTSMWKPLKRVTVQQEYISWHIFCISCVQECTKPLPTSYTRSYRRTRCVFWVFRSVASSSWTWHASWHASRCLGEGKKNMVSVSLSRVFPKKEHPLVFYFLSRMSVEGLAA